MSKQKNTTPNYFLIAAIVIFLCAIIAVVTFVLLPPTNKDGEPETSSDSATSYTTDPAYGQDYWDPQGEELMSGKVNAEIAIEDYGIIKLELDADVAPITVTNFVNLANEKFYDGLTFHRIIEGFMMQGGDPSGNGTGGSDTNIKGEFSSNGVENNLSHTRGAISMARSQMPNSASSQFFICHADSNFLDGEYACFGYVTEGIEVVDKICETASPIDNNGTIPYENQPVIKSVSIISE